MTFYFFPADTFAFLVPRTFFWRFFLSFLCFLAVFFFSRIPNCIFQTWIKIQLMVCFSWMYKVHVGRLVLTNTWHVFVNTGFHLGLEHQSLYNSIHKTIWSPVTHHTSNCHVINPQPLMYTYIQVCNLKLANSFLSAPSLAEMADCIDVLVCTYMYKSLFGLAFQFMAVEQDINSQPPTTTLRY